MKPQHSSPHNNLLKSFFDSNVIHNHQKQDINHHQTVKKQKSISFYGSLTPSYLKTPKENSITSSFEQEGKAFLTTRLQLKSPTNIRTELFKCRQKNSKEKLIFQPLGATRQYSQVNIKKPHLQQSITEGESHTKRQYLENKIKRFQSLRTTLNMPNFQVVNNNNTDNNSIIKHQNKNLKKILDFHDNPRPKYFTMHSDSIKENQKEDQKLSLRSSQNDKLKYSPNKKILEDKDCSYTTITGNNKLSSFRINLQQNTAQQKNHHSQFLHRQDSEVTIIDKLNQNLSETKRETKVPAFLNGRFSTKNQTKDQFKPKQFPKFFQSNFNSQKVKQDKKINEKKVLSTNKHAKSFSVLQTLDFSKKDQSFHLDFNSTSESFGPAQKSKQIQSAFIKNQGTLQKDTIINIPKPKQKNLRVCPFFEKVQKAPSNSLRQSFAKSSRKERESKSIERLNFDKKNAIPEILPLTFIPPLIKKISNQNVAQKPIVVENELTKSKKETQSIQAPNIKKQQKMSIIDDIKQTLIGCDLLSQQQYENVLENHKNDIMKPKNYQNNKNENKPLNVNFNLARRTSIKNIVDSDDQENGFEEEKKLAELAQMCEQKRSKWMLEQTDVIKESLKELSEFNTEKSLYDSEWKKISIKDFATGRNNRSNSKKFTYFDEVREEETNSDSKEQSKISSIRALSENCIDEVERDSEVDRRVKFKKSKQKSVKMTTLDSFQQIEKNCDERYGKLSLEDFQILWSNEEPIFLNKSTQNGNNFISYGARHKSTNFIVTIKKFQKKILKEEGKQHLENFIKSIKLQFHTLNHPNIEKIYAIFNDRYNIYIICEFTQTRLSQILIQENKDKSVYSSEAWAQYSRLIEDECNKGILLGEIIDGLEEIHLNHVIHKNIHPNSVRIVSGTVKISRFTESEIISQPISQICNEYICPQSLFDSTKLAMDIWCLGILTYELQIRRKPFNENFKNSMQKAKKILQVQFFFIQCSFDIPLQKASLCEEFLNSALIRNPKDRASIFDLKNIWTRKLKENNFTFKSSQTLLSELQKLFE